MDSQCLNQIVYPLAESAILSRIIRKNVVEIWFLILEFLEMIKFFIKNYSMETSISGNWH